MSLASVWSDLRHAFRLYRSQPGFAAAALLALTLGIGGCGLILSLAEVLLFRPVAYPEAERLVRVFERNLAKGFPSMSSSPADFAEDRAETRSFAHLGAYHRTALTLLGSPPERLQAAEVSGDLFAVLGVPPALGTTLVPHHDRPEEKRVAVLGHALWERRFGADPGIVGRAIQLNGEPYTVLGVMPAGFQFSPGAELWVPLGLGAREAADRESRYLTLVGRLRPGVPLARAQGELDVLAARRERRFARRFPIDAGWSTVVRSLPEEVAAPLRPALLVLLAGAGLLLVIACGNVANLLLARAAGRGREIATRAALGASAGRLIRQILTESTVLTLAGGLSGLATAALGSHALVRFLPDISYIAGIAPRFREAGVDLRVALVTLSLALASGLVSGLAPAFRLAGADLRSGLQAATGGGWRRSRAAGLLAMTQLSLSFVLLVGAGLLVHSFWRLTHVDPGFRPEGVLTLRVELPKSQYGQTHERAAFFAAALDRLRALPGVERAGAVSSLPLGGASNFFRFTLPGRPAAAADSNAPNVAPFYSVTPGYLETLRIRLTAGRLLEERDRATSPGAPHPIVVSEAFARQYFPGEDPLGGTLLFGGEKAPSRIVGILGDVRAQGLATEGGPAIYGLYEQSPAAAMTFCLRSRLDRLDPLALVPAARQAILGIDPRQPVDAIATLDQVVRDSVADSRLALTALSLFAGLAAVLATVGIYSLLSHLVGRATREIGVRVALGAERRHVVRLVTGYGFRVLAPGLAAGALAAYAASRLLASQLFGVSRADAVTYAGAAALLTVLALLACLAPALRAARVDPREALAAE
jgi:putative ABC transport system permease protein